MISSQIKIRNYRTKGHERLLYFLCMMKMAADPSLSHYNYLVINMKINGTILVTSNLKQTKIGPLFSKQLMHTLFVNGCYVLMASLHKKWMHVSSYYHISNGFVCLNESFQGLISVHITKLEPHNPILSYHGWTFIRMSFTKLL